MKLKTTKNHNHNLHHHLSTKVPNLLLPFVSIASTFTHPFFQLVLHRYKKKKPIERGT